MYQVHKDLHRSEFPIENRFFVKFDKEKEIYLIFSKKISWVMVTSRTFGL